MRLTPSAAGKLWTSVVSLTSSLSLVAAQMGPFLPANDRLSAIACIAVYKARRLTDGAQAHPQYLVEIKTVQDLDGFSRSAT